MRFNIAAGLLDGIKACESWRAEIQVLAQPPNSPKPVICDLVDYICPNPAYFVPDPNFPKDASIRFVDFKGIEKEKDLVRYLVKQAAQGGTDLSVTQSYSNEYKNQPHDHKDVRYVMEPCMISIKYILVCIYVVVVSY